MINIKINGQAFTAFTSARVSRSFRNISGNFNLSVSPVAVQSNYPIKLGDSCEITVSGSTFLTGFVESITVQQKSNDLQIDITGRDRTADVIDSTISVEDVQGYTSGTTLKALCELVLKKINATDIGVVDKANRGSFGKDVFIQPSIGETAFSYLQRYAEFQAVFLTTDGLGNLVLDVGSDDSTIPTHLILRPNNNTNNILSSTASYNNTKRYHSYVAWSQGSGSVFSFTGNPSDVLLLAGIKSTVSNQDPTIRASRVFNFQANAPLTLPQLNDLSRWTANVRTAESKKYTCEVQGHTYDGANLWGLNKLVTVNDQYAGINGKMLIDTLTFMEDVQTGPTTEIVLVPKESYKNIALQDQLQVEGQAYGSGFSF